MWAKYYIDQLFMTLYLRFHQNFVFDEQVQHGGDDDDIIKNK